MTNTPTDITLPHAQAATFDAALQSHHITRAIAVETHHGDSTAVGRPPLPTIADAFTALVEAGWDAEAARRPHDHHTPWRCTSTSRTAAPRCTWVRCSAMPTAAT
ncbi:hypothetical protein MDOR_23310 [Mycolicibacterium doricum]|uniref:DUF222 domain-containing protein n=1 Tax=Mycolicibacterium doricum TaxID=126673 RepID=A0A7I7VU46_9MYCO|nr:hypothetical protein MDOR_23310 [Mycolicibacterium doricum]